ncbi:MAG: glycosyltransferase family 4 protein [Chloroflexota bacterium]
MSHPKVIHIITASSSLKGLMLNQLLSLQQAGYEVVAISSSGPEVKEVEAAGIRCITIPIKRDIDPITDVKTFFQLVRVLRRERPEIVHTHLAKASLLGQIAARLAGVPLILNTIHGYHFHELMSAGKRRFYIELEKFSTLFSDLVLSQNQEDIQSAIDEGICAPEKLLHIGNGIDLTRFAPEEIPLDAVQAKRVELALPTDALVVGFVGRLAAKRKGFLDFLAMSQQVARKLPNVYFLVAGETDRGKPDAVDPLVAKSFGINERCRFVGFQPNHTMPVLYAMMDVMVLPSPFEGIPRAVMEASAMGIPVVATDVRGNREATEHGRNGWLVPFGQVDALVEATQTILRNQQKAQRMGQAGVELARERFDERKLFDRIKRIYADLLPGERFVPGSRSVEPSRLSLNRREQLRP